MFSTLFELKLALARTLLRLEGKQANDNDLLAIGRVIDADLNQFTFDNVPQQRAHVEKQILGLQSIERKP